MSTEQHSATTEQFGTANTLQGDEPTGNTAVNIETFPALLLSPASLAGLSSRAMNTQAAAVNAAYEKARQAWEDTCEAMGRTLTEQIARHLLMTHPGAARLRVRHAVDVHAQDCDTAGGCTGHNSRLVPTELLDHDRAVVDRCDPMSPVTFWLERLSALMAPVDAELDIANRRWLFQPEPHIDDWWGEGVIDSAR